MFPDEGIVIVGFSGGADSMALLDILHLMSRRWRKTIQFVPVYVDAGFFKIPKQKIDALREFCKERDCKLKVIKQHSISRIVESSENPFPPCFTCSRMRRKVLLETANSLGANLVALGHHKDDLIETFFLNILFSRRISAILPKQPLFKGLFHLIRPFILIDEDYIKRYAKLRAFPVIEKNCPFAENTERKWVKKTIARMETERPGIKKNIVRSLFHPKPEYLWGEYRDFADKLLR